MITRLTKIQLIIFVVITLIGGAIVGGRYAQVDRLFVDRTYSVAAFFDDSGGIFEGAQVTYRGVGIGRVGPLTFTGDGVKVELDIEKDAPKIPADVEAHVHNLSAVGEQYVLLEPQSSSGPYLDDDSVISKQNTSIPLSTATVLVDVTNLVDSVDTKNLKIIVDELGAAFKDTGPDLSKIIDTATDFIDTASANIDVTRSLIRDTTSVLQTQIDKQGQFQSFSKNLALLSDTLVSSDSDLRRLLEVGAPAAKLIREVIAENADDITVLLNNLITTNRPVYKYIDGIRALFILYPYVVNGAPTVVVKTGNDGGYEAHFGAVLTTMKPPNCTEGYERASGPPSPPGYQDPNAPLSAQRPFPPAHDDCTSPDPSLNPRGANDTQIHANELNRAPVAVYDLSTGKLTPTRADAAQESNFAITDSLAAGKDSWKWLLLGPAASK